MSIIDETIGCSCVVLCDDKVCTDCGIDKPLCHYYLNKVNGTYYPRGACKVCTKQQQKDKRDKLKVDNPDEHERRTREFRFTRRGLTEAEFHKQLELQDNGCAICLTDIDEKSCHIDHCHTTGRFRSLLYRRCNLLIGHASENAALLRAAAAYVDTHTAPPSAGGPA